MTQSGRAAKRASPLRDFGNLVEPLERLPLPVFAIGKDRRIRWLNRAARELVGPHEGARFTDVVAPASLAAVREQFARKVVGGVPATEYEASLIRTDGSYIRVEISSVTVEVDHAVVGIFGVVSVEADAPTVAPDASLTPRQAQVLQLLARGCSTDQIAGELGVARETVRNHIRAILKAFRVHSRLEAVIEAHRRGLA